MLSCDKVVSSWQAGVYLCCAIVLLHACLLQEPFPSQNGMAVCPNSISSHMPFNLSGLVAKFGGLGGWVDLFDMVHSKVVCVQLSSPLWGLPCCVADM